MGNFESRIPWRYFRFGLPILSRKGVNGECYIFCDRLVLIYPCKTYVSLAIPDIISIRC